MTKQFEKECSKRNINILKVAVENGFTYNPNDIFIEIVTDAENYIASKLEPTGYINIDEFDSSYFGFNRQDTSDIYLCKGDFNLTKINYYPDELKEDECVISILGTWIDYDGNLLTVYC